MMNQLITRTTLKVSDESEAFEILAIVVNNNKRVLKQKGKLAPFGKRLPQIESLVKLIKEVKAEAVIEFGTPKVAAYIQEPTGDGRSCLLITTYLPRANGSAKVVYQDVHHLKECVKTIFLKVTEDTPHASKRYNDLCKRLSKVDSSNMYRILDRLFNDIDMTLQLLID